MEIKQNYINSQGKKKNKLTYFGVPHINHKFGPRSIYIYLYDDINDIFR